MFDELLKAVGDGNPETPVAVPARQYKLAVDSLEACDVSALDEDTVDVLEAARKAVSKIGKLRTDGPKVFPVRRVLTVLAGIAAMHKPRPQITPKVEAKPEAKPAS